MKYSVIRGRELTSDLAEKWTDIQQSSPSLASPYFCPEFTRAVAAVRDDVFIGVLENQAGVRGFFPFHRKWGGIARPVALALSDYHGVIADAAAEWDAEELLRGCRLIRWEFDHLLTSQHQFSAHHRVISKSPIIEVDHGFDGFLASRDKAGKKQIREIERKREKLEAQSGPLTFTFHSEDQEILRQLISWKSLQCRQTGTVDYFSIHWCARLIERIHAAQGTHFGGILSCLHAGDTLAAAHFAMRSREVWHSWFPAYNHALEEYSPGMILLLEMIAEAAKRKIRYIDLGKGVSLYKKRVMTSEIEVAEGCLEIPTLLNRLRDCRGRLEDWSRQSILKPILRVPGRIVQEIGRKKKYL